MSLSIKNYLRILPTRVELATLLLAVLAFLFNSWSSGMLFKSLSGSTSSVTSTEPTQKEKLNPILVQISGLGQTQMLADWYWMRGLQDSSLSHVAKGEHPDSFYDFSISTDLDPAYYEVYGLGANLLTVARNDHDGALELLEKAQGFRKNQLGLFPESSRKEFWWNEYWLPLLTGYIYLFEMNDIAKAAPFFTEASSLPNSPPFLKRLTERLEKQDGQYEIGIRLINRMIQIQKDESLQASLKSKRDTLVLGFFLFEINRDFEDFLQNNSRYRKSLSENSASMQRYWKDFLSYRKIDTKDPFGGKLLLGSDGRIFTTTPHQAIFGLPY